MKYIILSWITFVLDKSRNLGNSYCFNIIKIKMLKTNGMTAYISQLRNVMQSSMTATLPRRQTKLESHIDSLKRHLNDCTDSHQKDPYTRITTEIAAYVATSPINGSDVKIEIETIHDCLPPNATAEQKRRCGKQN